MRAEHLAPVSPPSEQEHSYQVKTKAADAPYVGPEEWVKSAPLVEGSWWPEWTKWLTAQSGEPCEPPRMGVGCAEGESLPDAPGLLRSPVIAAAPRSYIPYLKSAIWGWHAGVRV